MRIRKLFVVSPGLPAIEHALRAAETKSIASARIFDLLIYGTMLEHGIKRLATFNDKDFRTLPDIEVVPIPLG